jgi:HD-GYP domain-containing protein (c-di-GMP phosphodiesterase class II)/CHASE2 domain-containing sensor protein
MSKVTSLAPVLLRFMSTMIVVGLAILAQSWGLTDPLDRRFQDALIRLSPNVSNATPSALPDVAVVTIDPRSLRSFDDWPWPRSRHAEAVDRLRDAGARAIAFDIDFSSRSDPEEDAAFADSVRRHGRVVLAAFSQFEAVGNGAELEIVNRPIPELEEAAAGIGSVLVPIDFDGVVRNAPSTSPIGGEPVPSLARSAMEIAATPEQRSRIRSAESAGTATLIDFRRMSPEVPTLSYVDLLEGKVDWGLLDGRVVFIGATAAEFQDLWATPIAPAFPGVMIQAIAYRTAAAEAMGESVLEPSPPLWTFGAYFVLGLVLLPRSGMNRFARLGMFVATSLGVLGLAWFALWHFGALIPMSVALLLVASQYALGIESLQRKIEARAAAQESSLSALARLGESTPDSLDANGKRGNPGTQGLELALELLGEVVDARGAVLIRATPPGRLTRERLEWRPTTTSTEELSVDMGVAERVLSKGRTTEVPDSSRDRAPIIYTPLIAGSDPVGVLIVFCNSRRTIDALARRTIATVGAQMALTAQNIRLIDTLRATFESSIAAVAGAVEARDGYTDQHCRRLAAFSSLMGARLAMPEDEIRAMELGALLHDVGKIGIPDSILNKPGRLSHEERVEMQRHPEIGAGIVAPVVGLEKTTLDCVIHHHERWDGSGYPDSLMSEEIPLSARIVAIVDVWDALSTQRPYKKAFTQEEVKDILMKGRGTQFDPDLVDLFFEILHEQGEEMLELIARTSATGLTA